MAGWNDIRQPHDPWDDEDLNPLRLAQELSGMIQPPNDPAVRAVETLFSVGPNVLNQLNRIGSPGEVPAWEQGLGYSDVMRQAGYEGLLAEALGLVGDLAEPGFGEIGAITGLAATVPRQLLEAFGKVTSRTPDRLPERLFHGTPTPVSPSQLRPSKSGMLGPGFYTTVDPEEAMGYSSYPGSSYVTPAAEAAATPSIYSGYSGVPSERVMDIWEQKRFSPEEATQVAEVLKHYPGLEPVVELAGRPGGLTPYSLFQGIWDNAPEWAIPEILSDLGYDAVRATDVGHTTLMNPSRDFVAPWDVDKMLTTVERSGQFSPEELDELLMLVDSFINSRR